MIKSQRNSCQIKKKWKKLRWFKKKLKKIIQ